MKRIVCLETKGIIYELDKTPNNMEGMVVKDISFKRDGYQGIFKGEDESHYLVRIENALTEKEAVFKLIPINRIVELMFVEVTEKEKKEDSCEQPTNDLTIANG